MNKSVEHARRPLWLQRWPWLTLLLIIAAVYYGSYYRHGINFRDEGGTLTLVGQRLIQGERPYHDVELGYNVGWFVPIVGLFKITGVHFVGLRIFFMILSTLTAVLGFITVERAARHAGRRALALPLAFFAGLMLVLVPGMMFKNYNPLAAVANSWCLVSFILARGVGESCRRALVGGLVLGATWLARIDIGTFFTALWFAVLICRVFGLPGNLRERSLAAGAGLLIVPLAAAAMHLPILWHAHAHGYHKEWLGRYPGEWTRLASRFAGLIGLNAPSTLSASTTTATPAPSTPEAAQAVTPLPAPQKQGSWKSGTLARTTWSDVQAADPKKRSDVLGLFLLTYWPILIIVPLVGWAMFRWFHAVGTGGDASGPLAALALLGGCLTTFPQFFFWRPDAPHLSEFGPGYWTATIAATALLGAGSSWRTPARWVTVFLALHVGIWLWRILPDRWCGTVAARESRKTFFEGENGVRVYETKKEVAWMNEMLRLIRERSRKGDYLVTYPYHPAFNVLADRPTYEKNVYIDNAEAKPNWNRDAIARIENLKPRLIIVSNWDVNGTDASRFQNWAAETYGHIRANYEHLGTFDDKEQFELYVRKDLPTDPPVPALPPATPESPPPQPQ